MFGDVIEYLDENDLVKANHVRQVMDLPEGATPALKNVVQAYLLKTFAVRLMTKLPADSPTAEDVQQQVAAMMAQKQELLLAGYGETSGITQDLLWALKELYGANTKLMLAAYGVQPPAADPRKVELCATYVPGDDKRTLGRTHSFILYTNQLGAMSYVSVHANEKKVLEAEYGPWMPSRFPDKELTRATVAVGDAADGKFDLLTAGADEINRAALPYHMLIRNCNTAARFLLEMADLKRRSGANIKTTIFGWYGSLGKDIEKKVPKQKVETEKGNRKEKTKEKQEEKQALEGQLDPPRRARAMAKTSRVGSSSAVEEQGTPARARAMADTPQFIPAPGPVTTATPAPVGINATPATAAPLNPATANALSAVGGTTTTTSTTTTATPPSTSAKSSSSTTTVTSTGTHSPPRGGASSSRNAPPAEEHTMTLFVGITVGTTEIDKGTTVEVLKEYKNRNEVQIRILPDGPTIDVDRDVLFDSAD